MAKKSAYDMSEELEEGEAGTQSVIAKEEPPPEVPPHEGVASYRLLQDANLKHQDHKAGDVVSLTHEEYQATRAVDVHCEAVEVTPPV